MSGHPAPYSFEILEELERRLAGRSGLKALDPCPGVGRGLLALPRGATATFVRDPYA